MIMTVVIINTMLTIIAAISASPSQMNNLPSVACSITNYFSTFSIRPPPLAAPTRHSLPSLPPRYTLWWRELLGCSTAARSCFYLVSLLHSEDRVNRRLTVGCFNTQVLRKLSRFFVFFFFATLKGRRGGVTDLLMKWMQLSFIVLLIKFLPLKFLQLKGDYQNECI